ADGGLVFACSDTDSQEYGRLRNLAYVNCNASAWTETNQPKRTDVTGERIVLTGSNLNPCVISNYIYDAADATYICFIKRGTGTWRFAERPYEGCGNRGPVLVEQGRLEFDSFSCLGKGDRPFTNFWEGASDEQCRVPYIYRIGNGVNDASAPDLPTMAYLGPNEESSSRTFAIFGSGRIENAGGGLQLTGGVFSDSEGDNTLVLAGPGANKFTHVTNGIGTLSVVKEDDGEWALSGNVILSSAAVTEGTLIFEGTSTCPSLKVDGGASFEAKTSDLAVNNFKVDAVKGIGSVKGVSFAEEGLLELSGVEEGFSYVELGGDLAGSAAIHNLCKWAISVNGKPTAKYVASIFSNTLKVSRRGIKVILR
ncbi:MAG: hypothetical protein J6R18_09630, partial [Kiritimatiellae bacterium]|nr:hypothetical protein [Kiritimatiellia bacterium]